MGEDKKRPHAGHGYTDLDVEHHDDGSHTLEYRHEDGKSHSKHAVMDLDSLHDSLEDHLRDPEEIEDEVKERGVDPEKLEEVIEPGLHDKALDHLSDKVGVKSDDVEEEVSPGIHEKMGRLLKGE